jgi:hypothetical protein
MTLLIINLDIEEKYKTIIRDVFKVTVIILILHYLLCSSKLTLENLINKTFMNNNFIEVYLYIMISLLSYHLIVTEIIQIA